MLLGNNVASLKQQATDDCRGKEVPQFMKVGNNRLLKNTEEHITGVVSAKYAR